jgi:hypothetical protein
MYIPIYTQTSFQSRRDCMFIENVIFQPRSTPSESYMNQNGVFYKYLNPLDSLIAFFQVFIRRFIKFFIIRICHRGASKNSP